ncbi:MAG: hypothetical protein MI919_02340, partial [Holophagales bacterium]|nr:hypothetical protein [Holophagales bacterium]
VLDSAREVGLRACLLRSFYDQGGRAGRERFVEAPEVATQRATELREEMAIAVDVGEHLGQGRIERDGQVLVLDVYEARWIAGEMRLLDHDQARWIEVSEIHSLEWAEADVPVLEALRHYLDGADR